MCTPPPPSILPLGKVWGLEVLTRELKSSMGVKFWILKGKAGNQGEGEGVKIKSVESLI